MDVAGEGAVWGVNVGHPIVTNGDFVAELFSAVKGGDAALLKLLWDFSSKRAINFQAFHRSRLYC